MDSSLTEVPKQQTVPEKKMAEENPEQRDVGMHEAARREKLEKIRALGFDPWGTRFDAHQPIGSVRSREDEIRTDPENADGKAEQHGPQVRVAGRIVLQRRKGKLIFADLQDWTGKIQLFIGKNQVGDSNWELAQLLDLSDIVGPMGNSSELGPES